jgi:cytochrome c oxidase subunit 2
VLACAETSEEHRLSTQRSSRAWFSAAAILAASGAFAHPQSALHPEGDAARLIAQSWWIMLAGAAVLFLLVALLTVYAVARDPAKRIHANARVLIVGGGVILPVVTLTMLLVYGTLLGRELTAPQPVDLRIDVIARQFWWDVRYPGSGAAAANEIHIPVGRNVEITLQSEDVIHSFWVPALAGKLDVIPGQPNVLRVNARVPGRYRGQCAEFCGILHAHMALQVFVLEEAQFTDWLEQHRKGPADRGAQAPPAAALLTSVR